MKENELMAIGISAEKIEKMKQETVTTWPKDGDCYVEGYTLEKRYSLVPVDKIKGILARGDMGESWWDHYTGACGAVYDRRLMKLIDNLKKDGLDVFRKSFTLKENAHEISVAYFEDEDLYYVIRGQHRTTMAKIVSADSMMIEEVTIYKKDEARTKLYLQTEELKGSIQELLEKMNFTYKEGDIYWNDNYVLFFHEVSPLKRNIEEKGIYDLKDLEQLNEILNDFYQHSQDALKEYKKRENNSLYKFWVSFKQNFSSKEDHYYFQNAISLISEGWTFK